MKITLTKKEIAEKFGFPETVEIVIENDLPANPLPTAPEAPRKTLTVDFPSKTAKQILEDCDNKAGTGKLLYNTEWYKKEAFFTKEKTRAGKRTIDLELSMKGRSWNECDAAKGEREMLNFAEVVYLLAYHPEYQMVLENQYTWTSGRASDGSLVRVGDFDGGGARVNGNEPGSRAGRLGVSFSRSESMNPAI